MPIRLLASVAVLLLAALTPACSPKGGGGTEDAGPGASSGDAGPCTGTALTGNAGSDRTVEVGATVFLSGRAENGVPGAFQWMLVQVPEGSRATLDAPGRTNPSFVADLAGTYVASLVVSDACGQSVPDTVVVQANGRPVADAGSDRVVTRGTSVQLSGAGSSDPEGAALTYAWSILSRPAGSTAALSATEGVDTGFTPDVEGSYRVQLVVSDGALQSLPDEVTFMVASPGGNLPPSVSLGSDRTVARRTSVTLTAWGSDPEQAPLTYAWTQLSGPPVVLAPAGSAAGVTFTTPDVEGELTFSVTVSDGELSGSDEVRVTVVNRAPIISSLSLSPDEARTLDDLTVTTLASDADGDSLTFTYAWKRNGAVVAGESARVFPHALTTKGDVITSVVTVSDGREAVSGEQSLEIQDTLPSLTASAPLPSQTDHCSAVSFDLVASDADGDPLGAFVVRHGPAAMAVSATGTVSWDGCLPMFERSVDVSWSVGLSLHPDAKVGGVLTVNDAARSYALRRTGIEIPNAHSGLEVSDLDGNGTVEMLIASSRVLYELARSGTGYAQRWVYPYAAPDGTGFTATVARDVDGDGKQEIFFASSRLVVKLDGVDRRELARYETGAAYACRDLEIADLSGDGDLELVCMGSADYSSSQRVAVLDAATLGLEWETASGTLGMSLALGNVDADAAIEIVTANGYVYDGATRANQWAYGPGFGSKVDTGDLDGDGVEEIVGMKEWDMVTGFSAVSKSPLWEQANFDNDALLVVDFEEDAKAELLIGDGQWGEVTAYRYDAGTNKLVQLFAINSQEHGVTSIGVGDVDGDGAKEFVWGSGATSSGEDVFVIAGRNPAPTVEWTNTNPNQLDGPFVGGYLARVTSTSRQLLFGSASTNSGYDGSRLVSLDPESGALRVSSEIGSNWSGAFAFTVSDYDADGRDEALVATASYYDGYFTAWDFDLDIAEWTSGTGVGGGVAVVSGDVNADGFPDLVTLTGEGHVRVRDVKNQVLVWDSTDLGSGVDVQLADVDGDGVEEIIALADTALHVYAKAPAGPATYLLRGTVSVSSGLDLLVADLDGDLSQELYVLQAGWGQAATVRRFDGSLAATASFAAPVDTTSLHAEALGSGRRNLLLGVGNAWSYSPAATTLRAVDPSSGAEVWRSPPLPGAVSKNSVFFTDLVGTALPEIVYATQSGMSFTR